MQVVAFSAPPDPRWRWRIVDYEGQLLEESGETFPTIASAVEQGARRLRSMEVADRPVPPSYRSAYRRRIS